jgi:hypothetical protein
MVLRHPRGAEDRDALPDVAQGVEAALDLVVDPLQPQLVPLLDVAGLAQQLAVAIEPGRYESLASSIVGSNSSIGLPEGSSTRICLPPTPSTISLRKDAPAARSASTLAARSSTSS